MVEGITKDRVAVMWHDGETTYGRDATHLLTRLLGGWNPNTVNELRAVLCKRSLIDVQQTHDMSDDEFLQLLDIKGALTYQHIPCRNLHD